jgi:purine-binding chemotaxis protein CheW
MSGLGENLRLLIRVGRHNCALRLLDVVETMRPLPVEPLSGAPEGVCGVACLRGGPVPVVDLTALMGESSCNGWTRFVCVRSGGRTVALAVSDVLGIRYFPPDTLTTMPPLLQTAQPQIIEAIASLDADLFLVLKSAGLIPPDMLPGA